MNGKDKCEKFREIRKNVAEKYGLEYTQRECHHEGDCPGTCPLCDAEVTDLQRQLDAKGITDISVSDELIRQEAEAFEEWMSSPAVPGYGDGSESHESRLLGDVTPEYFARSKGPDPELPQGDVAPPEFVLQGMPAPPQIGGMVPEPELASRRTIIETNIAGLKYYDATKAWAHLEEGMELELLRVDFNKHDKNAVAVYAKCDIDGETRSFMLGYLPRSENKVIAALMDMGWSALLRAELAELDDHDGKRPEIIISVSILHKDIIDR